MNYLSPFSPSPSCALSALRVSIATRPLPALTTTAPSSEYRAGLPSGCRAARGLPLFQSNRCDCMAGPPGVFPSMLSAGAREQTGHLQRNWGYCLQNILCPRRLFQICPQVKNRKGLEKRSYKATDHHLFPASVAPPPRK